MLLSSLFQERVSNFAINVLLLQNATITEQNMRVNILESSGLAKPEELNGGLGDVKLQASILLEDMLELW